MGRAQIAMEYMAVVALLLGALAVVFSYSLVLYNQGVATAKAQNAVSALASAAEQVAALGEGTTLFISVEFPPDVHSGATYEHAISVELGLGSGTTDIYEPTDARLKPGAIPTAVGIHEFRVEMVNGKVAFTEV